MRFYRISKADIALCRIVLLTCRARICRAVRLWPHTRRDSDYGFVLFRRRLLNRDYDTLIAAFRQLDYHLIICCSCSNHLSAGIAAERDCLSDRPRREFARNWWPVPVMFCRCIDGSVPVDKCDLAIHAVCKPIIATRITANEDYLNETNAVFVLSWPKMRY